MGIDLSRPDELDWMARGRRGEIAESRFSERVSDEELEREAENRLVERMFWRLVERGLVDEPNYDDAHEIDEIVSAARQILSEVGDRHRRKIEEDVWQTVESTEDVEADFVDEYETRVADRVLNAYFAEQSGSEASTVESLEDEAESRLVNQLYDEVLAR